MLSDEIVTAFKKPFTVPYHPTPVSPFNKAVFRNSCVFLNKKYMF
jgi:hypothetical protein